MLIKSGKPSDTLKKEGSHINRHFPKEEIKYTEKIFRFIHNKLKLNNPPGVLFRTVLSW